jgi:uncharacterized protein (DUF362 family)
MEQQQARERVTVSLARIRGHNESEDALRQVVTKALAPLGGLARHVPRGSKVLLKPNQTLFKTSLSGSTTSPRLIRALIALCFEAGAREVWVAEASGHAQMSRQVMGKTGMVEAVKGTGAHVIFLDEIAEKVYDFGEEAGELRYMPFSFELWMMSERCGWREEDYRADDYLAVWRWWLGLHVVNQIEIAIARRRVR